MKKIISILLVLVVNFCYSQILPKTNIVSTNTLLTVTKSNQNFSLTVNGSAVGSGSIISSPDNSVTVSTSNSAIYAGFNNAYSDVISLIPTQLDISTTNGSNVCFMSTNSSNNWSISTDNGISQSGVNIELDSILISSNRIKLNNWRVPTFPTSEGYYVLDGNGQTQSVSLALNDFITVAPAPTTGTVAVDTGLDITLQASTTYIIEGALFIGCSGTGGVKVAIDVPAGATFRIQGLGRGNTDSVFRNNTFLTDGAFGVNVYNNVSSQFGSVSFQGAITTGASGGSIKIQFASGTSGETSTIYADGAYLRAIK